jgi:predicted phage terminase large subunit-like protein
MKRLSAATKKRLANPTQSTFRKGLTSKYFFVYLYCYYGQKLKLPPAGFHIDLINDLQSVERFIAVMGFRGCAKSTILEAFAEWQLVTGRSRFTVWIGATDPDAKEALANIASSIRVNERLIRDYEIDIERKKHGMYDKWSEGQLSIGGCTIIARSRGQKLRGRKFEDERINTIIVDDLEDTDAVKTAEKRKATRVWFFAEVINATAQGVLGDDVKIVMLGNLVHKDCLIANLMKREDIVRVHKVPLLDEDGNIAWTGLYPNMAAVEKEKEKVMLAGEGLGHVIWNREYLLKLVDEDDQVIKREDIHTYDDSWLQRPKLKGGVGVDLAISEKETADYTAMIKGCIVENDYGERRLLVMKNNVKARMDFPTTMAKAKSQRQTMPEGTVFFVEDVAYQKAAIQVMERNGIPVQGMTVSKDKRSRLVAVSGYIKSGMVMFPENETDDVADLIEQLIAFGMQEHDDMVDGLVHLIDGLLNTDTVYFA